MFDQGQSIVAYFTAVLLITAVGSMATAAAVWLRAPRPLARLSRVLSAQYRVAFVLWWIAFTLDADLGTGAAVLLTAWILVHLGSLPWQIIDEYLFADVLCRDARSPSERAELIGGRRISVHVPCYAEPPELVCRTLSALALQRYADFEVLVVDNNTEDERLWRPVEEHCRALGPRFRFLHVSPLSGAKAGALNVALCHTAADAELVAVLDCDYEASPDFLGALAGLFDDERLAFVQTAHDYRDWANNAYQRGCYGEYRTPYATYMVSRDARGAPLTVGTMCLIRREALVRAGGWSSVCATEDSELAIRLHAAGYRGRYVPVTLGRGLIPETFAAYRRQRARWIGGPVQELRQHWRLYLPRRWARPSALSPAQKLLFAHHGMREAAAGVKAVAAVAAAAGALVFAFRGTPPAELPAAAVVAMVTGTGAAALVRWTLLRQAVCRSVRDSAHALLASASLAYVARVAAIRSLVGIREPWRRTVKFPASTSRWTAAVRSAGGELVAGLAWLAVAAVVAVSWPGSALAVLLALYLLCHAVACLAAPVLALRAERHLRRSAVRAPQQARDRVCGRIPAI